MAATSRALATADVTNRTVNKPAIVAANVCEVALANIVTNVAGTLAAGDQSASLAFDRKYLISRFRHLSWKANATGTHWYVVIDRGAAPTQYFDCLILDQPNFPAGTTVTVRGDDAAIPAVPYTGSSTIFNAIAVVKAVPARTNQIVAFDPANEWNPRYLQIDIFNASTFIPQVGQLWLGHTVQFPCKSDYGSQAPQAESGESIRVEVGNGISIDFAKRSALTDRKQNFTIADAATGPFLTNLKAAFDTDTLGGLKAFWYVEDPTLAPSVAIFAKFKTPLKLFDLTQTDGPFITQLKFDLIELGGV